MRTKLNLGKRILSMFVSLAMLVSIVSIPNIAFAVADQNEGYSTNRADLTFEYMGQTASGKKLDEDLTEIPSSALSDFTWEQGGIIWIGVYMEHMDRLSDIFTDGGLSTLTLSMLYDSNYLSTNVTDISSTFDYLNGVQEKYDITGSTYPYKEGKKQNTPAYETTGANIVDLTSYSSLSEYPEMYPQSLTNKTETELMVTKQVIRYDSTYGGTNEMFYGDYLKPDKTLVAIFPFTMGSTQPSEGTKIVEGFLGASTFVLNRGAQSYNFNNTHSIDPDVNLNNRYNIVSNTVNLFPAKYTVTYDANTDTYADAEFNTGAVTTESVAEDSAPTLQYDNSGTPTNISSQLKPPSGKIFAGWSINKTVSDPTNMSAAEAFDTNDTVTGDTTVYAQYKDGYSISFDPNGGTLDASTATLSGEGTAIYTAPTDPTRSTGVGTYEFKGWNTKQDGTGSTINASPTTTYADVVTLYNTENGLASTGQTATLYAKWEAKTNPVTLTFVPDKTGATLDKAATVTVNKGDKVPAALVPTAKATDYTFDGWYKSQSISDKTAIDFTTYTVDKDASVYAHWTYSGDNKTVVTFHKNDTSADDTYETITIKSGTSIPADSMPDDPKWTGGAKGFDKWTTDQAGSNLFTAGTTTLSGSKADIYAQWTDKVTITYDLNGLGDIQSGAPTTPDSVTNLPGEKFTPASLTLPDGYTLSKWSTDPLGQSGTNYTPGTETTLPSSSETVYAIWTYDSTKDDAVTVSFDGNGTTKKPATVTPASYTIVCKAGDKIKASQMPTATRSDYTFNHWDTSATAAAKAAGGDGKVAQDDITVVANGDTKAMTVYAIWTITDPSNKYTVTFDTKGGSETIAAVDVAKGDNLGDRMPADPTKDGYSFDGWKAGGSDFNKDTEVNSNITAEAQWSEVLVIKFDANGGTVDSTFTDNPNLNDIKLTSGTSVSERSDNPKKLPKVTKENYTFLGWFYEKTPGSDLVELTDTDKLTSSVTVKAKWQAMISVTSSDGKSVPEYEYDGNAKTPISAGNYKVNLLSTDDNDTVVYDLTSILGVSNFTVTYTKKDDTAISGAPTNAGEYKIATLSVTPADKYTEYTIKSFVNQFTVTGKTINLTVKNNYQYLSAVNSATKVTLEKTDAADATETIDLADACASADFNIVFTDVKDSSKTFTNQMPNTFGDYTISFTANDGSNYKVGTLTDGNTSTAGDAKLHLIPRTRVVQIDYGAGKDKTDPTKSKVDYTTVTMTIPTDVTKTNEAKTTLKTGGGTKTALPVEGTDFTAPDGKKIDKFTYKLGETDTDFTVDTDIPYGADPFVVTAVYKDAQWKVTFTDTKATPEAAKVYTIEALKSIADTGAVKKVDDQDPTEAITDVPKPASAPDNMMFGGWTIDETLANTANLTADDLKKSENAAKMFTKDNKPGDSIVGNKAAITVYAVYVKSDDATLKNASFKENNNTGAVMSFVGSDWKATDPATEFDADTTEYYVIGSNDAEKAFAALETTNEGSSVKVTYGDQNKTDKTVTAPLEVAKNASSNDITVEVTAPDGTTKKTYTFHVLRKAVPEIKLGYGNSPAGLIYRMGEKVTDPWSAKKINEAIQRFDGSDVLNKTYVENYVPDNAETGVKYVAEAWRSYRTQEKPNLNYDLDEYATFVYQGNEVNIAGYKVLDELGKEIADAEPTIDFVVKRQTSPGVSVYSNNNGVQDFSPALVNGTKDTYDLKNMMIRMDVYFMNYSYQYTKLDGTKEELKSKRPVIVLSKRGDVYLNTIITVNDGDVDYLMEHTQDVNSGNSLVAYRCMDFVLGSVPTINDGDVDYLKDNTQSVNSSNQQYYKNIK